MNLIKRQKGHHYSSDIGKHSRSKTAWRQKTKIPFTYLVLKWIYLQRKYQQKVSVIKVPKPNSRNIL